MAPDEPPRSRAARRAAEDALVRVVHHYGGTPGFVLLGGLVPDLLCSQAAVFHAGTTDVDVQVDLEIATGGRTTARLEQALGNAEFSPDPERVWRWQTRTEGARGVVKFELLADLDDVPGGTVVSFDDCQALGAVNLRGTGFAVRDYSPRRMSARIGGVTHHVEVNVTGLAGFLLAKIAAAYGRRKEKDWYDIAFVLLNNDAGDPALPPGWFATGSQPQLVGGIRTAVEDLEANFTDPDAQGPLAYASQMVVDHPDLEESSLRADAVVAVRTFCRDLLPDRR